MGTLESSFVSSGMPPYRHAMVQSIQRCALPFYHYTAETQDAFQRYPRPSPLRQQILAVLQAHPAGLSAEELRVYVHATRPIGDTLQGMLKGGVITAQERGPQRRYMVAE